MNNDIKFYKKAGRPKKYKTDEQRHEAKLEAKRKWYKKDKSIERTKKYNEKYYKKHGTKSKTKKHSSSKFKHHSRHHSKHKSKKHSRHTSSKHHHRIANIDEILNTL